MSMIDGQSILVFSPLEMNSLKQRKFEIGSKIDIYLQEHRQFYLFTDFNK